MAGVLFDFRLALRGLLRQRGFTAIVLLTLTLAIGSATAMFALVNTVLFQRLPFPDEHQLLRVRNVDAGSGVATRFNLSGAEAALLQEDPATFAAVVVMEGESRVMRHGLGTYRVNVVRVSGDWNRTLGVAPQIGRSFSEHEIGQGRDSGVAIIAHRLWQERFAGGDIRGRTLALDDRPYEIIGVFPRGFNFPYVGDVWTPAAAAEIRSGAAFVRLFPQVGIEQARERASSLTARIRTEFPQLGSRVTLDLEPARESLIENEDRTTVALLAVAVAFVLIACANVANLLLARSLSRTRDLALHTALGASRARQYRQLLCESVLLSLTGAVCGLIAAAWVMPALQGLVPSNFTEELAFEGVALDGRVAVFAFGVALLIGAGVSMLGLSRNRQVSARDALASGGRGNSAATSRTERALVAAQLALALTVLTGTGVLLDHVRSLYATPLGVDAERILTARVQWPSGAYPTPESRVQIVERVRERLTALPGVEAVGITTVNPFSGGTVTASVELEGASAVLGDVAPRVNHRLITPGLLQALGTRLVQGRDVTHSDDTDAPRVVIVSKTMAERLWAGKSAIGSRVRIAGPNRAWMTVVGVAPDIRDSGDVDLTWYVPYAQMPDPSANPILTLMVRTVGDPSLLARPVDVALQQVAPGAAVFGTRPLVTSYTETLSRDRLGAIVAGLFSVLGLSLATIGVYGLIFLVVAGRKLEFGIRLALGARSAQVTRLVLRDVSALLVFGLLLGACSSFAAVQAIRASVPGVAVNHAAVFAVMFALLSTVSTVAGYLPARRAGHTAPTVVLRGD